jgi:hypothetical protein
MRSDGRAEAIESNAAGYDRTLLRQGDFSQGGDRFLVQQWQGIIYSHI